MLFLEQDSTTVPKFAYRFFCPGGNLVGECLPQTLLMRIAPLENHYASSLFGFFQKQFRFARCFSPIYERASTTILHFPGCRFSRNSAMGRLRGGLPLNINDDGGGEPPFYIPKIVYVERRKK